VTQAQLPPSEPSQPPKVNWFQKAVQSVWTESEPIFVHGGVGAVLLLVSYGLAVLGSRLFPKWHHEIEAVEKFILFALLYLFGGFTVLIVAVRLFRHLWHEVKGGEH